MVKVLLVEDNELNRDMLTRRLDKRGYTVINAANGVESIQLAKTLLPQVILMDLSLPIMDGWTATRMLKNDPDTHMIPVIALTAHALISDRARAFHAGCDEFETKPINFPRLLQKIEKLTAID